MLLASGTCVVTSVLLIVGLCGDNRKMIIPWIISIFFTTILDFILFIYLMTDMEFNTGMVIFAISDLSIIVINICAMACVVSQYREYRAGRGQAGQRSSSKLYHDGRLALTSDCIGLKITADQTSTMSMSRTPNGGYLNIPPTPTRSTSVQ
ncbi:hypothetical protein HDE_03727 [Halotydeus destructor]|nr:hypothetical protein HDE_03727 [Halotydeus destructor]